MVNDLAWQDPIIRDGFSQRGYIKEVEGLHGALRFRFRPMIPEHVERVEQHRDREGVKEPEKARARTGAIIAQQLESWDVKFKGEPVEISEHTVRRMRMALQTKLYNIVAGFSATDIDPEWLDDETELTPLMPLNDRLMETTGDRVGNS